MANLNDILNSIVKEGTSFSKEQLIDLINTSKNDEEQFVKEMGIKLQEYIEQLFLKKISKGEFEDLVSDIASLQEIKTAQISAQARVRAEKLVNSIENLVLKGLLTVIKV